jgi:hypothetical protein
MKKETQKAQVYFNGNGAVYTGKTQVLYGGLFYEAIMIEGHEKGKKKLTQRAPK